MIAVHDKLLNILEKVAERILSVSNTGKGYMFEVSEHSNYLDLVITHHRYVLKCHVPNH